MNILCTRWGEPTDELVFERVTRKVLKPALTPCGIDEIVLFDAFHKELVPPDDSPGRFTINITGHAGGGGARPLPRMMWGHELSPNPIMPTLYNVSGAGIAIVEPDSGKVVAELVGNNLYMLFSVNHSETSLPIYRRILQEATAIVAPLPTLEELTAGDVAEKQRRDRSLWRHLLGRNPIDGRVPRASAKEGVVAVRATCARLVRQAVAARKQLAELDTGGAIMRHKADAVLDRLLGIPEVERVEVEETTGELVVHTHPIYVSDEGKVYLLGKFRLSLPLTSQPKEFCAGLRFLNKTNRVRGYFDTPHVMGRVPCLGEAYELLVMFAQADELEAMVLLIVKYLETYNKTGRHSGAEICEWPNVSARTPYPKAHDGVSKRDRQDFQCIYYRRRFGDVKESLGALEKEVAQMCRALSVLMRRLALEQEGSETLSRRINKNLDAVWAQSEVVDVELKGDMLKLTIGTDSLVLDTRAGTATVNGEQLPIGSHTVGLVELLGRGELLSAVQLARRTWKFVA